MPFATFLFVMFITYSIIILVDIHRKIQSEQRLNGLDISNAGLASFFDFYMQNK